MATPFSFHHRTSFCNSRYRMPFLYLCSIFVLLEFYSITRWHLYIFLNYPYIGVVVFVYRGAFCKSFFFGYRDPMIQVFPSTAILYFLEIVLLYETLRGITLHPLDAFLYAACSASKKWLLFMPLYKS